MFFLLAEGQGDFMECEDDSLDPNVWEIEFVDDDIAGPAQSGTEVDCPDCRGTGKVCLLVTTRPCQRCGGSGKAVSYEGSPGEQASRPMSRAIPCR